MVLKVIPSVLQCLSSRFLRAFTGGCDATSSERPFQRAVIWSGMNSAVNGRSLDLFQLWLVHINPFRSHRTGRDFHSTPIRIYAKSSVSRLDSRCFLLWALVGQRVSSPAMIVAFQCMLGKNFGVTDVKCPGGYTGRGLLGLASGGRQFSSSGDLSGSDMS